MQVHLAFKGKGRGHSDWFIAFYTPNIPMTDCKTLYNPFGEPNLCLLLLPFYDSLQMPFICSLVSPGMKLLPLPVFPSPVINFSVLAGLHVHPSFEIVCDPVGFQPPSFVIIHVCFALTPAPVVFIQQLATSTGVPLGFLLSSHNLNAGSSTI